MLSVSCDFMSSRELYYFHKDTINLYIEILGCLNQE